MKYAMKVGILQVSIFSATAALALVSTVPAQAASFVSTFRPPGSRTEVGNVNPATGAYTTYGNYELQLTDIAVNTSGTVYGVTYDQLYTLNSGTDTQANPFNITSNGNQIFGFNGLAFDGNNNLYGIAGANPRNGDGNPGFYSINTSDGVATLISNLGSLAPTAFGFTTATPPVSTGDTSDIVFNGTSFFAVSGNTNSRLFTIDPTTGATSLIGNTGVDLISGLTFESGVLRGYTTDRRQVEINTSSGAATFATTLPLTGITTFADGSNFLVGGAASTPVASSTAVPEPFTVIGTLLGAGSALKMRKRFKATNKL